MRLAEEAPGVVVDKRSCLHSLADRGKPAQRVKAIVGRHGKLAAVVLSQVNRVASPVLRAACGPARTRVWQEEVC